MKDGKFEPYEKVIVRDRDYLTWYCDQFSHYSENSNAPYCCISHWEYAQCLPYEGNEHLVGTRESPEEPETFEFKDDVEVRDVSDQPWRKAVFLEKRPNCYVCLIKDENNCYRINCWAKCRKVK